MEKRENAGYQHFPLSHNVFKTILSTGSLNFELFVNPFPNNKF